MHQPKFILMLSVFLLISCENTFFPETCEPIKTVELRATPAGVIKQLFNSYTSRDINQFTQLFLKDTFKFYIAQSFDRTTMNYKNLQSEKADSFMLYVSTTSLFYYWDYNAEIYSTTNLFKNATDITVSKYEISNPEYQIGDKGDTVYAEVKVSGVSFEISVDGIPLSIANQPQVFLMRKDSKNLWVIWKWYDIGSEM